MFKKKPEPVPMVRCPMCGSQYQEYGQHVAYIGDQGVGFHGRCLAERLIALGIQPVEPSADE